MPNIYVAENGKFGDTGTDYTSLEQLDSLVSGISTDSVTLYLHGGLVDRKSGVDSAQKFSEQIGTETTPICFIWESGLADTLFQNIDRALTSIATRILYKRAKEILLAQFTGKGVAASSDEQLTEIMIDTLNGSQLSETQLKSDYEDLVKGRVQDDPVLAAELESIEPEVQAAKSSVFAIKGSLLLAKILAKSAYRFVKGRNHEIVPTLLEEVVREVHFDLIGVFLWDAMKEKAHKMFIADSPDLYIGTGLLARLSEISKARKLEGRKFEVNIVGHSAGTIAICHALDTIASSYPDLKLNKVVFVAAAVTAEQAVHSIINKQNYFNEFRMFTMRDNLEKKDSVGGIYTASLLYFISGLLEGENDKPLAGMMRFYRDKKFHDRKFVTQWRNFIRAPERLVLSTTGDSQDGFEAMSTTHGGFGTEKYTVKSIKYFIHS